MVHDSSSFTKSSGRDILAEDDYLKPANGREFS